MTQPQTALIGGSVLAASLIGPTDAGSTAVLRRFWQLTPNERPRQPLDLRSTYVAVAALRSLPNILQNKMPSFNRFGVSCASVTDVTRVQQRFTNIARMPDELSTAWIWRELSEWFAAHDLQRVWIQEISLHDRG